MQSNLVKSRIGVNRVSSIVEGLWECGWQEYAPQNDDAFDGVIIMKRGTKHPAATGGMVFAQVKCGSQGYKKVQKQHPDHIGVFLGSEYIEKHVPRWNRAPGPPVLIFVDDETSKELPNAYWVDLRNPGAYSTTNKGLLLLPKTNRFSHHSKGDFHQLCGSAPADYGLEQIVLKRRDSLIPNIGNTGNLRREAGMFYASWRNAQSLHDNPALGRVLVNRTAWEHIKRPGRLPERIVQSWFLLGAARKMIHTCKRYWTLGNATSKTNPDGNIEVVDFLGLRAKVAFPHRHQSVVQVVLKRSRLTTMNSPTQGVRQKIWFYSVYELRRGSVE